MSEVFKNRREKIYEKMSDRSLLVLFSGVPPRRSADQTYPYTPDRNYYYLTGQDTADHIFCAVKINGEVSEQYFITRPDERTEIFNGRMSRASELAEQLSCQVLYRDRFEPYLNDLFSRNHMEQLWADAGNASEDGTTCFGVRFAREMADTYPYLRVLNAGAVIGDMRRIKEPCEIETIKEAIRITGLGIDSILAYARPEINERELQARFESAIKINGALSNAFEPIIASGKNSISLHYCANSSKVSDGDMVLLDLGAEYEYYNGDISRTFPANGKFSERQRYYYEAVLDAQEEVIRKIRPGMHIKETTEIAREAMFPACSKSGIAKELKDMDRLLPHGVSHYLGLDTHDSGEPTVLSPGMVITVEPGIYITDLGIGIRIEDDVLITEDGCEVLSSQIPKTVKDIEAAMRK